MQPRSASSTAATRPLSPVTTRCTRPSTTSTPAARRRSTSERKNRAHRRKLGLYAPIRTIEEARAAAELTDQRRAKQRVTNARHRDLVEDDYRSEFTAAVVSWLDFAPEHAALADKIALSAAEQAVVVGSGRVGRTRKLALEERAALAARASIRHRLTDYEERLSELDPIEGELDDFEYRRIRRDAHEAVDAFLDAHRRR